LRGFATSIQSNHKLYIESGKKDIHLGIKPYNQGSTKTNNRTNEKATTNNTKKYNTNTNNNNTLTKEKPRLDDNPIERKSSSS
jgi:hypothetical protein